MHLLKHRQIIACSIGINLVILIGIFFIFNWYNADTISGGVKEMISTKVVEKNITEYRELARLESDVTASIEDVSDSVVTITITKNLKILFDDPFSFLAGGGSIIKEEKAKVGGGSGIIISSDGYIITNKHVVDDVNAEYSIITKEGETYKVEKIWLDPVFDIAVIKIIDHKGNKPATLKTASFIGRDNKIRIGQFVVAIGYALGEFEHSATFGIISGKNRRLTAAPTNGSAYIGLYQTDTPINAGNSGGPLIDINGKIIGINTALSAFGNNIAFAIPINQEFIMTTLESITKHGAIIRPLLGIEHIDLNKSLARELKTKKFEGALIENIIPRSPADQAGLKKGDIIIELNGEKISADLPLLYQLMSQTAGSTIKLLIYRGEEYLEKNVILGERKQN